MAYAEQLTPLDRIARGEWPTLALVGVGLLLPVIPILATLIQPFSDPRWFYHDPLRAAEIAPECCKVYFGAMSMLGVMMWAATAAACLFTALMLFLTGLSPRLKRFAFAGGLLTAWMTLDDAFLLHENVLPALGVPQNAVLAAYGLLGLGYTWMARSYLRSVDGIFFVGACVGFAVSIGVDVILLHTPSSTAIVVEDGAKFFGIWYWMVFHGAVLTRGLLFEENASQSVVEQRDLATGHQTA
ncbi:MAG: hypothetical protein AAGH43_08540 [Pseudomonadota bacterium]